MSLHIAAYIDHTILKPSATNADIEKLCAEAATHHFAAVCVPPYYIRMAKRLLEGTAVKTATVIGFPFGYSTRNAKMAEIAEAITDGADELDMVHNIAAVKNGDWLVLKEEIKTCTEMIHRAGRQIKVIIESGILTDEEIIKCCEVYAPYHIDFMKTSTGYAEAGASVHAVQLMRSHLPESIAIKASGGIRNFAFAKELIEAGATRIGASAGIQLIQEAQQQG